jgi:hypothetical protein
MVILDKLGIISERLTNFDIDIKAGDRQSAQF